jgi:hypothetical protein
MSRIFISHSNVNNAAALGVARWLEDNGWDDYFLDVSASRGLAPGERWQEALKAAAHPFEAVIFWSRRHGAIRAGASLNFFWPSSLANQSLGY